MLQIPEALLLLADGTTTQRLQSGQLLQLLLVDPVGLLKQPGWGLGKNVNRSFS
jgi:hypothetical protein